jgi:hypothetical protein
MTAPLSFKSEFGYYGLRVNPTFDQALGSVRKPLRIPIPQRRAKWYALGPYRALILDAQQKFNDYESALIDYRRSGAEAPESAAQVRESAAQHDPSFDDIVRQNREHDLIQAHQIAAETLRAEKRAKTAGDRQDFLRASTGPNRMHPVVAASHAELAESGIPHAMPAPRPPPVPKSFPAPPQQWVAAGQPQVPEFPTFEHLNLGQPLNVYSSKLTPSQNLTYEQIRSWVVEPTWSS